jgi:hypothetical protein
MIFLLLACGCRERASDWDHYDRGGTFNTSPPVYSADKSSVAYCTTSIGQGALVVANLKDQSERTLSKEGMSISSPRFLNSKGDLLCRVEEPFQSARLARWNAGAKDFQFLSPTGVIDEVIDLSKDGERLLLGRRSNGEIRIGQGVQAVAFVSRINNLRSCTQIGSIAGFSGEDLLFMPMEKPGEIWRETAGKREQVVAQEVGYSVVLERSSGRGRVLYYSKSKGAPYQIDRTILALDLKTQRTWTAGMGHDPVILEDDRTLLLEGYQEDIRLYSAGGELIKKWKTAKGYRMLYEDPATGAVLLYTRESNGTEGTLMEFDAKKSQFTHVMRIP